TTVNMYADKTDTAGVSINGSNIRIFITCGIPNLIGSLIPKSDGISPTFPTALSCSDLQPKIAKIATANDRAPRLFNINPTVNKCGNGFPELYAAKFANAGS